MCGEVESYHRPRGAGDGGRREEDEAADAAKLGAFVTCRSKCSPFWAVRELREAPRPKEGRYAKEFPNLPFWHSQK